MSNDSNDPYVTHTSPFAAIRREAEDGSEYWSARDLARILAYDNYRNFLKAIAKARIACEQSGYDVATHFVEADEMVTIGSGAKRKISELSKKRSHHFLMSRRNRIS